MLIICNDTDRPCARLVAEKINDKTAVYLSTNKKINLDGGWTPVGHFGVIMLPCLEFGFLTPVLIQKSFATYPDGKPRIWQPEKNEVVFMNDKMSMFKKTYLMLWISYLFKLQGKKPIEFLEKIIEEETKVDSLKLAAKNILKKIGMSTKN